MNFKLIFAILAISAFASAQNADPLHFLAQVVRHRMSGTNVIRDLVTQGVLTRNQHVVVPARFVQGETREELRVYLGSNRFLNSTDVRTVEEIFIHPNFDMNSPDANNIAVLRLSYSQLDSNDLVPRTLGELTVAPCTIYGFEGMGQTLTIMAVNVTNQGCRDANPFCTTFRVSGVACNGFFGTPVICTNQDQVAGIANVDSSCVDTNFPPTAGITFLSIQPFANWINDVSSARAAAQISLLLMALGVVIGKFIL